MSARCQGFDLKRITSQPGYRVDDVIGAPLEPVDPQLPATTRELSRAMGRKVNGAPKSDDPTQPEVWPKQNKLERAFGAWLTAEYPKRPPPMPQALTFRLARATSYTPDWISWDFGAGRLIAYETKGFWRQAGRIKIKMAARLFPMVSFIAVTKEHGAWKFEHFSA